MQKFMLQAGDMVDARRLESEIVDMGAEEALWSTDDEDEDSMGDSQDFDVDFNRQLDESSVASRTFESSFGGKSKQTFSRSPNKRDRSI